METETITPIQPEILPINPTFPERGAKLSPAEIRKAAEKNAEERQLPKVPGRKVGEEELTTWLNLLTPAMWGRLMIYIYRTFPVINRKLVDPDAYKYIDVLTKEPWDLSGRSLREYMKNQHGGGYYGITVNDVDSAVSSAGESKSKTIIEANCKIPLDEAKPRLNLREVDFSESRNGSYIVMLQQDGVIDERKQIIANRPQQPQQNPGQSNTSDTIGAVTQMAKDFAGMFGKLNDSQRQEVSKGGLNELFLEKLKQESPNTAMAMITPFMQMMEKMINKPQDTSGQISIKEILAMSEANHKAQMDMFAMLVKKENPKEEDFMDKLIKWKTAFPDMFGGKHHVEGEPFPKTTTEVIADVIKELGLPLLGFGSQLLQMTKGVRPIVPVTEGQAKEMVATVVDQSKGHNLLEEARMQEANRPKVVQMPQTTNESNSNPPANVNPNTDPNFSPIVLGLLQAYGNLLINSLKSGTQGEIAGEQLKNMAFMLGQDIHAMLKSQGKDKILYTMKHTEFWKVSGEVYGEEHIEEFVDRFLNFEAFLDDGGQEEDGKEGA